ncbi:MAG: hypothetical protein ABR881_15215 [Candidatus Sulfotelmatobacter sp.]|jgi:hypothetical protein
MIQTALGINGYDCMFCDGNTAEEYEAIAVALLRTAEAIRNGEEGRVECLGKDGKVLASVLIHHCGPECDEDVLADAATIEEFTSVGSSGSSLRVISRSMIEQYRRATRQ